MTASSRDQRADKLTTSLERLVTDKQRAVRWSPAVPRIGQQWSAEHHPDFI